MVHTRRDKRSPLAKVAMNSMVRDADQSNRTIQNAGNLTLTGIHRASQHRAPFVVKNLAQERTWLGATSGDLVRAAAYSTYSARCLVTHDM